MSSVPATPELIAKLRKVNIVCLASGGTDQVKKHFCFSLEVKIFILRLWCFSMPLTHALMPPPTHPRTLPLSPHSLTSLLNHLFEYLLFVTYLLTHALACSKSASCMCCARSPLQSALHAWTPQPSQVTVRCCDRSCACSERHSSRPINRCRDDSVDIRIQYWDFTVT